MIGFGIRCDCQYGFFCAGSYLSFATGNDRRQDRVSDPAHIANSTTANARF